jgi:fructokinase
MQIGIDFGGTKIEAAALDADGSYRARLRIATPADYDAAVAAVCDLAAHIEHDAGETGTIGIGTPGSLSPTTGTMRNANSTWLNGRRFRDDLQNALGRPIRMANDANCLAVSETCDGAATGADVVFAIIIGTGCGGGLVVGGKLVEGTNTIAGEWGHNPLPWMNEDEFPGPTCWCGKRGCIETFVSGTGFRADYQSATGNALTGEEIVARMRSGEKSAAAAFDRYAGRLGRALAVICNIVDPDVIVLGGGMSNVGELYRRLPVIVAAQVFADTWRAKIVPAKWGDASGVRGAARLWPTGGFDRGKEMR